MGTSIDRKEEAIKDILTQLATVTEANGYDFNLTVDNENDFIMEDKLEKAKLPYCFIRSELDENYEPQGNILSTITTGLDIYVYGEKDRDVQAKNRIMAFKLRMNIKKALQKFTKDFELSHASWGSIPICFISKVQSFTGWADDFVSVIITLTLQYNEEDID